VRLEGPGKLKKSNDLIGNRTFDLPACSIGTQGNLPEMYRLYKAQSDLREHKAGCRLRAAAARGNNHCFASQVDIMLPRAAE
jgi:hypothetical protein